MQAHYAASTDQLATLNAKLKLSAIQLEQHSIAIENKSDRLEQLHALWPKLAADTDACPGPELSAAGKTMLMSAMAKQLIGLAARADQSVIRDQLLQDGYVQCGSPAVAHVTARIEQLG